MPYLSSVSVLLSHVAVVSPSSFTVCLLLHLLASWLAPVFRFNLNDVTKSKIKPLSGMISWNTLLLLLLLRNPGSSVTVSGRRQAAAATPAPR